MRIIDLFEQHIDEAFVNYDGGEDMIQAAQNICNEVKRFAIGKPINVELRPEIVHGNCHGVVLTDLFATEPGSGVGTPLMRRLIELCDEAGLNLFTDAEGPRSADFYTKLGASRDSTGRHQFVWYPDISEEFPELYESEDAYPARLSPEELVDYAIDSAHADEEPDYATREFLEELFDEAEGILARVPLKGLKMNGGVAVAHRAEEYSKLSTSAPPIIVDGNKVLDGNHRVREARRRGETHIMAYRLFHNIEPI